MRSRGPAPLDPLLAEASWLALAGLQPDQAGIVDLIGGVDAAHGGPEPKLMPADAWSGVRLVGYATLDGGYDEDLDWPADSHCRFTARLFPHWSNADASYAEVLNIPVTGSDNNRDYLEPAFILNDDGSVSAAQDMDSVDEYDPFTFEGGDIGEVWAAGIAEADWEIIVDSDNGDDGHGVTVKKNDVTVESFTGEGTLTLPEPADGSTVQAGPFQNMLVVDTAELLDGIDGDPLIAFDSSTPAGWSPQFGAITTAPPAAAWFGQNSKPWTAPDNAVFDVGAEDSATWAFRLRPMDGSGQGVFVGRNANALLGGDAGFVLADVPGFGLPWQFRIGDGTNVVSKTLGSRVEEDQTIVIVLDRSNDELRGYIDGEEIGSASDATDLGTVAPDAGLELWRGISFGYGAAIYDEALTDEQIAGLAL